MARSNFPGTKPQAKPQQQKAKLDKKLGVYTFVDEDGNVTQIKKVKKSITKYYPNEPSNVDKIVGDYAVIGISDTIAMGIGDDVMAYAEYV